METPGDAIRNKDNGPDLKSKFFKDARKSFEKQSKLDKEKYLMKSFNLSKIIAAKLRENPLVGFVPPPPSAGGGVRPALPSLWVKLRLICPSIAL